VAPTSGSAVHPGRKRRSIRRCKTVAQGRGTYGTRRLKHLLAQDGLQVSRRRIGRVLAQAGLRCKTRRKFKAPKTSGQAQTVAPNQLNREFTV
jgi:putative transposase